MRTLYQFHFKEEEPAIEMILDHLKTITGLQIQLFIQNGLHILSHPLLGTKVKLIFRPNLVKFSISGTPHIDYLSGTIFKILLDMGGSTDFPLPDWAGISYMEARERGLWM
jgi:hypothetical protein